MRRCQPRDIPSGCNPIDLGVGVANSDTHSHTNGYRTEIHVLRDGERN
ncbi:hypothetical protein [Arthrobacter alkaliphilus]|nr:hypothetical protein [Arthrobacter alkaliphilus]